MDRRSASTPWHRRMFQLLANSVRYTDSRRRHLGGGEGGRESEGRDQGGPSLSDAKRHLQERAIARLCAWSWSRPLTPSSDDPRDDLELAYELVAGFDPASGDLDDLWLARDLFAVHNKLELAESLLWYLRGRTTPAAPTHWTDAGRNATACGPLRSGSASPAFPDPGAVSPGSTGQNHQTEPVNGGVSVW